MNRLPESIKSTGESKAVLVARALALLDDNPQDAIEALAKIYYRKAYGMALGIVGNRDDALDATQETFVRIQRAAKSFDRSRPFFPWLYTILSNVCRTKLSRRARISANESSYEELNLIDEMTESPETAISRKEELSALKIALVKLSFEDREILTLKHFQDFSYDMITETLKIPRGTVMSRLYYARKRLAKLMSESGHGR